MKIEVNISKKYLVIIIAVIVIATAIVGVIAAVGDSAPNPGHHTSKLAGFPDCGANQYLKHSGGVWTCENDATGSPTPNRAWTTVVFCSNQGQTCPSGWTQYAGYTSTAGLSNCGVLTHLICYKNF